MTAIPPDPRAWRSTTALVVIGVLGASVSVTMPALLSAFAATRDLTASQLSTVASAELAGMTLATTLVGLVISWVPRRAAVRATLLLSGSMHLLASWDLGYPALVATRLVAGLGEGALMALAVAAAAALKSPDRAYGLLIATNMIWSSIVFASLPHIPQVGNGPPTLIVMSLLSFAALPMASALPAERVTQGAGTRARFGSEHKGDSVRATAIGGLAATLIFFAGVGCVWPLMERLGTALGVSARQISASLSAATLCGVAAGLSASWLGIRAGRLVPLTAGTLGLALAMTLLGLGGNTATYLPLACSLMASWIFTVPYYTGILAMLDPTGRLAALSMTAQFLGMTLGSALAGVATGVRVEYLGATLCLTALVVIATVNKRQLRVSANTA